MYLKKDSEADADMQSESNCFLLMKKFKKLKTENSSIYNESCESTIKCVSVNSIKIQ